MAFSHIQHFTGKNGRDEEEGGDKKKRGGEGKGGESLILHLFPDPNNFVSSDSPVGGSSKFLFHTI